MTILPESALQDLRYGVRLLRRNPGLTAASIFALALGIGTNTTFFIAWKATIARPVDARDADRMVNLALIRRSGQTAWNFSVPDYEAYRTAARGFSGVIAIGQENLTLTGAGGNFSQPPGAGSLLGGLLPFPAGPKNVETAATFIVSENYFAVLGVAPVRGRSFESLRIAELQSSPAVLISENYWQKRFGGDPSIIGRTVRLNGAAVTIIGITPHDFVGTSIGAPDFWVPIHLEPLVLPNRNWLIDRENECCRMFARLAPGVSAAQAGAEMEMVSERLRALHDRHSEWSKPAKALVWRASPFPLPISHYTGLKLVILLIGVAAAMVLAVACANAGSLQLARARSRESELAARLSLGASRARLVRQLLTESALVGILSGAVALLITFAFTRILATRFAESIPVGAGTMVFHVAPGATDLLFAVAVSLVAGLLFGLIPALESSRAALVSSMRSQSGTSSARSRRLQDVLVAVQVAASAVLLIFGSMFIHSAMRSLRTDPGYDGRHVIAVDVQFPESSHYTAARRLALVTELRTRIGALPGVADVTSARLPGDLRMRVTAAPADTKRSSAHTVYCARVQANYFDTLRVPVLLGRGFGAHSGDDGVVLSESAARQLWPGQNPVGHSLLREADGKVMQNRSEVIGVVGDTRGVEFDGSGSREVYVLLPDEQLADYPILVSTRSDPALVRRAIERVVSSVDPDIAVTSATLDEMLRQTASYITSTLSAAVASSVGMVGLLLAVMGIFGTVTYIVALRTREVGIRVAVGAQRRDILALILRESTRPVFAGLFIGVVFAVGVSYLLRGIFYGLHGVDGISVTAIALLFPAIGLMAAYPPSRRALRIDPMTALRYE